MELEKGVAHEWTVRESRSHIWVDVVAQRATGADFPAVITNISTRGCRLRTKQSLTPGELVSVIVPRLGSLCAIIRWSRPGNVGAEFVDGSDRAGAAPATGARLAAAP